MAYDKRVDHVLHARDEAIEGSTLTREFADYLVGRVLERANEGRSLDCDEYRCLIVARDKAREA